MIKEEWKYLTSRKMMIVVLIAIALIPAIYCYLYLSSMWNTYGEMDHIPVAIVNHDRQVTYRGNKIDIGHHLVKNLKKSDSLDYHQVAQSAADKNLTHGKYFMILTIPKNFSNDATTLLSGSPRHLHLKFKINSGENFIVSKMTRGAITAIKQKVAAQVTTLYATITLKALKGATQGMQQAANGNEKLARGARRLHTGLTSTSSGTIALAKGLTKFKSGTTRLAVGNQQIITGLKQQLTPASATTLSPVIKANRQFSIGLNQLASNVGRLQSGTNNMLTGEKALRTGTNQLVANNQLISHALSTGSNRLKTIHTATQNARIIANPVKGSTNDIAKVPNNGTGMAPFAIAIGIYVGAIALGTMYDGYLPRKKPRQAINWWASKASIIGGVAVIESILLYVTLTDANKLTTVSHPQLFALLLVGSILFLSLIFFLRIWLGGFGTWLVSIILVLQLSSSGGLYPTQLLNSLAKDMNPWLPMTYLIDALRSTISTNQPIQTDMIIMVGVIILLNALILLKFKLDLNKPLMTLTDPDLSDN